MSHNKELLINPDLGNQVKSFCNIFIHSKNCYPLQLPDGSYRTKYETLTTRLLIQHIEGKITLGTYALDEQSQARWLCLDADDSEEWIKLHNVAKRLEIEGLTSYLESSRRGGHLWLFTPTLSGKEIRQFGFQLIKDHDLASIELYPKQDALVTGVGSLVRLPLGIHRKSGKRYHFINTDGNPLAPTIRQQMSILANPKRIPISYIKQTLSRIEVPEKQRPKYDVIPMKNGTALSERIKNSISVYDFVSRYVELDQHSKGLCPFHDDQIQSFQIHNDRNFWNCYAGCGGGSVIDFWMKWRESNGQNASFTSSITELAQILFG
ncbi:MAG: hypothetical protein Phog2KO_22020 [Phototrophicaceae bacterium]